MPGPEREALAAFAACVPGLEPLLVDELREFAFGRRHRTVPGGVEFDAPNGWADVYAVNLHSALATDVLVRIAEFRCLRLAELHRKAGHVDWRRYLSDEVPVHVRARTKKSKLYHSGAVEQRVAEAIAAADIPIAAEATLGVHVRVAHDVCTISLDTSGEPLHRRGWRLETAKAPLREDLAAALLQVSGWVPGTAMLDPFVGSGTILIEAACRARRLAAGRLRAFAFEQFACFESATWAQVRAAATALELPAASEGSDVALHGSDRDKGAIAAATANALRAGVGTDIALRNVALSDATWLGAPGSAPPVGTLVCNPPYGHRVGASKPLRDLYASFGGSVRRALPLSWGVTLFATDRKLVTQTRCGLAPVMTTEHGGLRITAWSRAAGSLVASAPDVADDEV